MNMQRSIRVANYPVKKPPHEYATTISRLFIDGLKKKEKIIK